LTARSFMLPFSSLIYHIILTMSTLCRSRKHPIRLVSFYEPYRKTGNNSLHGHQGQVTQGHYFRHGKVPLGKPGFGHGQYENENHHRHYHRHSTGYPPSESRIFNRQVAEQ